MSKNAKLFIVCVSLCLVVSVAVGFFFGRNIGLIAGLAVGLWPVLLANDWCPGVWFLRWLGIIGPKNY